MHSKSIYQRLFEGWPDPRLLIEQDAEARFRVLHANAKACEYFSVSDGALDGQSLDAFLEIANKDHVIRAFDVCFKTGANIGIQIIPMSPEGVRLRSFFLNPLKEDGKTIAIDMTARLAASDGDLLRHERDDAMSIFASIFDASDLSILVTDHHRRIVRVNETLCRTFGWDPIDLVGREFTVLIPPEEHAMARQRHDDMDGSIYTEKSRELKIQRKDGLLANVIASSGVIELSGGRKFRISTLVDITHLKQIERDLRAAKEEADEALQAKSMFLANMSHELRTPLNAIIGFSDLMVTGTLGPIGNAHYQEYLTDIRFSATHLLSIINDVLDMSKIEAGQMKLNTQDSNIAKIADDVTRLMQAKAMESGITLKMDIAVGLKPLIVDQRMIRQVLLNLLSNAIKFTDAGGNVCLRIHTKDPQWLVMQVIDDGIGIPPDKLDEVMQPFGQVIDPRLAKGQGTGLGLPLARAMMELHGGSLSLESQIDKGTTVTCRLPLAG